MRKLIIFGLLAIVSAGQFCTAESENDISQPAQASGIIQALILVEGDPFTYVAEHPSVTWYAPGKMLVTCEDCQSSPCTVHEDYKDQIEATCKESRPTIRFRALPIEADGSIITTPTNSLDYTVLRLGRYDGRLHVDQRIPVALKDRSFTLVCDKTPGGDNYWFTDEFAGTMYDFHLGCKEGLYNYDKKRFDFTCDETSTKLHILHVTEADNGKVFGCSEDLYGVASLFKLTVK